MRHGSFAENLRILLKALVLSRTGLASSLNVDKSLVGRWAAGTVTPSEHNLANLTRFVAEQIDGFTMLDWDRSPADFAARLGVSVEAATATAQLEWVPPAIQEEARRGARHRGWAYEGLWRSTRASSDLPGRFLCDIVEIRSQPEGVIRFRSGIESVRYEGQALLLQHQLFYFGADAQHGTVIFGIFSGIARQRAEVIEGLSLGTLRDAGGSPMASACVMSRLGDLSGDPTEDDRRFEAAVAELTPLAPEDAVSQQVRDRLALTQTPEIPGYLRLLFAHSLSRGAVLETDVM
ncbi:helix-turn-helix transcriptional regulator [Brevundimonas sp. 2R-24]|uniref:Helix-turn-helix transcriptional regulator n=1 Tax=Peiella sedimenti TaxID=3061083 RepID=A0ABT8SJB9_9CAUL|nr:helix-turn-helix transcriptional regulator [Caulobacteraceae bacterium XZ-24]